MIVARSGGMTSAKWEQSDGIVALFMALDGASRNLPSVYDRRGAVPDD
jgi:hypothetical protein